MLTENALCEAGFSRRSAKWTDTGAMTYRSLRTARKIHDIRDSSGLLGMSRVAWDELDRQEVLMSWVDPNA